MKDVEFADDLGYFRDYLDRCRSGADDADAFSFEIDIVVPARGVESIAFVGLHTVDTR